MENSFMPHTEIMQTLVQEIVNLYPDLVTLHLKYLVEDNNCTFNLVISNDQRSFLLGERITPSEDAKIRYHINQSLFRIAGFDYSKGELKVDRIFNKVQGFYKTWARHTANSQTNIKKDFSFLIYEIWEKFNKQYRFNVDLNYRTEKGKMIIFRSSKREPEFRWGQLGQLFRTKKSRQRNYAIYYRDYVDSGAVSDYVLETVRDVFHSETSFGNIEIRNTPGVSDWKHTRIVDYFEPHRKDISFEVVLPKVIPSMKTEGLIKSKPLWT